jgi:hypothetical protein
MRTTCPIRTRWPSRNAWLSRFPSRAQAFAACATIQARAAKAWTPTQGKIISVLSGPGQLGKCSSLLRGRITRDAFQFAIGCSKRRRSAIPDRPSLAIHVESLTRDPRSFREAGMRVPGLSDGNLHRLGFDRDCVCGIGWPSCVRVSVFLLI